MFILIITELILGVLTLLFELLMWNTSNVELFSILMCICFVAFLVVPMIIAGIVM